MIKLKIYRSDFEKLCKGCSQRYIKKFIKKFNVEILEGQGNEKEFKRNI